MEHQNLTLMGRYLITVVYLNRKDIKPGGYRHLGFVSDEPGNDVHSGVSVNGFGEHLLTHQGI